MGASLNWRPAWTAETIRHAACQAIGPTRPDFVVAAGLGTAAEDECEAAALSGLVGNDVPVTALKSQTGYMGAATAAVELGLGLLCARQGFVPAIAHLPSADSRGLDLVAGAGRAMPSTSQTGLFLSCSWGGAVAAIAACSFPA